MKCVTYKSQTRAAFSAFLRVLQRYNVNCSSSSFPGDCGHSQLSKEVRPGANTDESKKTLVTACQKVAAREAFRNYKICEVSRMYRGQQSNTEGDDIWHDKGRYRGTLQSQQLQMTTERDTLVGITAAKEMCNLKTPHFPNLVMHLSLKDMILSQLDLIWENYIVSAYKSYYLDDSLTLSYVPNIYNSTFIPRKYLASESHSAELPKTSVGEVGFSTSYGNFTAQMHGQVKETIGTSYVQGAITIKNLWRKRKLRAQLDDAESRAKRSVNLTRCADSLPYLMNFNEKTNIDFISYATIQSKHEDRFPKPCHNLQAFSEKNTSMSLLRSAQETCCNVKRGSKISDDGCYFGSVLKSLVISSSSLGATEEVFSSTFIPQTDRSVDYTTLCGSLLQKGRCKVPAESDESLCLTNNTDSNINLHVRLSVHPSTLTSDVILSNINCTKAGERQGQGCFNRAACERARMKAKMADAASTLKSSQKNKSLLSRFDHCGNNNKSFLPGAKSFSTQLNYPLAKQHFLKDINFSILADSLLRTSKNDFSFLHSTGLQSASQRVSSHEMTDEAISLKHEGLMYEQAEVEVSLGTEDINKSSGRANLGYNSALRKQDFCFPSHFQNGVDNKQPQKETSGNKVDFYMESGCLKQVSGTEIFPKICSEKYLVEAKSGNSEETYCSFRSEMLFDKSRSRQNDLTTKEDKPTESKSKCLNIKQHNHQFYTKDTEDKESNENTLNENMKSDATQYHNIVNASIGDKVMEDDTEVHITLSNYDNTKEENQHVKLYVLDGLLNGSTVSSVCVKTTRNSKQICDQVNEIKIEESLQVTKETDTDASREGSQVLLKNTEFEMKAQFDLVLEELRMFHTIEEVKVEHFKEDEGNILKHSCSNTKELQDKIKEHFPSNKVTVGSNREVLGTKKDNISKQNIPAEVIEQAVPQQNMPSYQGDEESLYSAEKIEDIPKSLSWTPAFLKKSDKEENVISYTEKAVTFSHGIGRVTPLKTRTGPLRIGLSKKAKIKQLHPYLQ
ncbi:RAD51-associated protein 2 [Hyla sarda]|uniref:RAD51-associated protein 2 n=1 Tax=Hyla sarda TaxID=327740 RepID=UPI0024C3FB26|nr:RAD51-associated protein 2 [Hyla sarda]